MVIREEPKVEPVKQEPIYVKPVEVKPSKVVEPDYNEEPLNNDDERKELPSFVRKLFGKK